MPRKRKLMDVENMTPFPVLDDIVYCILLVFPMYSLMELRPWLVCKIWKKIYIKRIIPHFFEEVKAINPHTKAITIPQHFHWNFVFKMLLFFHYLPELNRISYSKRSISLEILEWFLLEYEKKLNNVSRGSMRKEDICISFKGNGFFLVLREYLPIDFLEKITINTRNPTYYLKFDRIQIMAEAIGKLLQSEPFSSIFPGQYLEKCSILRDWRELTIKILRGYPKLYVHTHYIFGFESCQYFGGSLKKYIKEYERKVVGETKSNEIGFYFESDSVEKSIIDYPIPEWQTRKLNMKTPRTTKLKLSDRITDAFIDTLKYKIMKEITKVNLNTIRKYILANYRHSKFEDVFFNMIDRNSSVWTEIFQTDEGSLLIIWQDPRVDEKAYIIMNSITEYVEIKSNGLNSFTMCCDFLGKLIQNAYKENEYTKKERRILRAKWKK